MENSFSYQPAADRYEQMPYTYWQEWLTVTSNLFGIVA